MGFSLPCADARRPKRLKQRKSPWDHPFRSAYHKTRKLSFLYPYPEKVRFEINQNKLTDYSVAAQFLNISQTDIVCVQHEYGLMGGPAGRGQTSYNSMR